MAAQTTQTTQNEQLTLHIGEDAALYVADKTTQQKLIDLLTAKVNAGTSASTIKTGTSPIAVTFFFLTITVIGGFILFSGPKKTINANG